MSEEDEPTPPRAVEPQRRLHDDRPEVRTDLPRDPEPVRDLDRREP
jgi:hypothetical protein